MPDRGSVTVEAALGIGVLTFVSVLLFAGIGVATDQLRCTDAAREAARLLARGQPARAEQAVREIAPRGARLDVVREGDTISAGVEAAPAAGLLPGIRLSSRAFAIAEPGSGP
ncbi:TadE family type IV pilus minor pilin [Amycolatopsis sp. QT-25]|uniref:TadE family type IV pilus minor pilin n=1 Tax=Amycolatopsis sp. QT-25 TaxID=3034022 RepID=UPI0023EBD7BB|nr:TadE family type IV pilus minor pilin [Amycolatopsis sp. QT-25]WET79151.1 TadE family type IV pilus minor pilin [Amycolatopsis sp. QT-25]